MSNAKVSLAEIVYRVLDIYNINEGWVVNKMKSKCVNRSVTILPVIYQKDKLQYFSNKSTMMISKVDHGKSINWVAIMYSQLVKKSIK
jgi:hypothetical protein